jgi:hypothetical protein
LPPGVKLCHLTWAYAISECQLMLPGDGPRQGCRSRMDHASIARLVASGPYPLYDLGVMVRGVLGLSCSATDGSGVEVQTEALAVV